VSRPSWIETWFEVADAVAKRSRCVRARVGAVIVDERQRIAATGYNGPPARMDMGEGDCEHWCARGDLGPTDQTITSYEDCPSIHAEMNALMYVDRSRVENGSLYVTGTICFTCAKAVANSGLQVVHLLDYGDTDYRNPELSTLEHSGLEVYVWVPEYSDLLLKYQTSGHGVMVEKPELR
jgi:dCMP deaminase